MSILRNLLGAFMPHLEARRTSGALAAANAELVLDVSGDQSALITLDSAASTLNATYNIQGTADGTYYFDLLAYPYTPGLAGGTLPVAAQPLVSEAVNAVIKRVLCVAVGGLMRVRVRLSVYAAGSVNCNINTDDCGSIHPYIIDQKAATLMVTNTGAAAVAVTATLPAAAGLRHYLDRISVVRSLTVAQTASATPTVVTTTNLPGTPALTFGTDGGAIGADKESILDFGGAGLAALLTNTATTIVCPATPGVIWRVNAAYRLGL